MSPVWRGPAGRVGPVSSAACPFPGPPKPSRARVRVAPPAGSREQPPPLTLCVDTHSRSGPCTARGFHRVRAVPFFASDARRSWTIGFGQGVSLPDMSGHIHRVRVRLRSPPPRPPSAALILHDEGRVAAYGMPGALLLAHALQSPPGPPSPALNVADGPFFASSAAARATKGARRHLGSSNPGTTSCCSGRQAASAHFWPGPPPPPAGVVPCSRPGPLAWLR